ncbi:GerAB/ArcD/ProY family transporter [Salipaludibacillus agaradhaerens]|uniref:GerAB/ArcD/ProY family transporter n=1 Tax=Salipaludibacillus agaradhaerens TaxID=76935 RepID=A0A9Q4B139_SALAG|nr:spore germination protein [Salipaludibacillus agaradhaerens]MCR6096389.1 GerAB/ArcD/ProY family transporter [Salipaludibacillus agaradhaerens]MCR6114052.1 GerAB/ArcD/ProY family transporter [Salipaludibacillus agaradhaerens]
MNDDHVLYRFSKTELFIFTYSSTITLGLIFLPYVSHLEVRSAWLKVIVAGLPMIGVFFLIQAVINKHKNADILHLFDHYTWKVIYYPILGYIFFNAVMACCWGVKALSLIVKSFLLHNTSELVICLFFLIVVLVGLLYGIVPITRFLVLFFIFEIIILVAVAGLFFTEDFRFIYVKPVMSTDVLTFLESSLSDLTRFTGVMPLIGFITYIKQPEKMFKTVTGAIGLVMLTYSTISLLVLGVFGFEQALVLLSPLTSLIQSSAAWEGVFQRMDIVFITVWVLSFYKIALIHFWFVHYLFVKLIPVARKTEIINKIMIVSGILALSFIIPGYIEFNSFLYFMNLNFYAVVTPSLMCIYLLMRRPITRQGELSDD